MSRRRTSFRPTLQPLEGRLVPAGVVTVATSPAGEVTVTGDAADNVVKVFRTSPGHFRVEGQNGTTLGPGGATVVDLTLLTSLTLNGGDGSDRFFVTNLGPLAGLTMDGGPGGDFFTGVNVNVTGNLTLAGGTESGGFEFDGLTTTVGGNLTLSGSGVFVDSKADRTAVGGSLIVNVGTGGASVNYEGTSLSIGRGIDFTTGFFDLTIDADAVTLGALATGESIRGTGGDFTEVELTADALTLAGGVRLSSTDADPFSRIALEGHTVRVGKLPTGESVAVAGGSFLSLIGAAVNLAGGIDFAGGATSGNRVEVHGPAGAVTVGALASGPSIRFAGGAGFDTLAIDVSRLTLAGGIDFAAGGGTNALALTAAGGAATVGKLPGGASIRFAGGSGDDTMTLGYGTLALAGGIDFAAGDGANALNFASPTGVAQVGFMAGGASIQYAGGAGTDALTTDAGRLALAGGIDFAGGAGDNVVKLGTIGGQVRLGKLPGGQSVRYAGGDGKDDLRSAEADLTLAGGIEFAPGGGANTARLILGVQRFGTLATGQSVLYTGGGLADTLDLNARRIALAGSVEMAGGDGDNKLTLAGRAITLGKTAAGDSVRYTGGAGKDEVKFDGPTTLAGSVSFGGGDGDDSLSLGGARVKVGGPVTFDGGAGSDQFFVNSSALAFGRGVTFAGGPGGDFVLWVAEGTVTGDVTFDFGSGSDRGTEQVQLIDNNGLAGGLTIQGALTITAPGNAASFDQVFLENVAVTRSVAISLGDGFSNVFIDNLAVGGNLTLDTNGGNDRVDFERSLFAGPSVVGGTATIRTGDGDDTVRIGSATGVNGGPATDTRVRFLGGLTVDGGDGTDTRNAIDTANAFPAGPPTGLDTFETVVA